MPRESWFYAVDDIEHGPVSSQELKALAAAEKIDPRTLVWQEGLADWVPAEKVPGLFATSANTPPPPAAPPAAAPPRSSRSSPRSSEPVPRSVDPPPPPAAHVRRPAISLGELRAFTRPLSFAVFALGVFFILMARGCDGLSARYATRLQAMTQVAELQFRDEWDATRTELEAKRDEANKRNDASVADVFKERLTKLSTEKTAEQEQLRRGSWRTLAQAARDAEANYKMWGFWRECLFVLGLVLLTTGAAAASYLGAGAERWFFLVVLGGIIFSLLGSAIYIKLGGP